ncbi:DNA-binding response regulator [Paenibacillaceae bacterium]|nr:DNA-binding response regulator [Paenibacillaceae bacterium]
MNKKILVVDDDAEIRHVLHVYLRNEGYAVLEAADGLQALEVMNREQVQLIILDVMLPNLDGIQACMKIREASNIPIIMLSAKGEDMQKILGLSSGADDYVTKPFNPMELIARIKAQLRRQDASAQQEGHASKIVLDDLIVDRGRHMVAVSGREIALTPTEFSILLLLASHQGHVFSTDKIYQAVWKDPSLYYSENTVMAHIRNIREKIEADPKRPQYIKTVWGVGYKIEK